MLPLSSLSLPNSSLHVFNIKKMVSMAFSSTLNHLPLQTHLHSPSNSISELLNHHPSISLLENCKSMKEMKQIHSQIIRSGLVDKTNLQNRILAFCCKQEVGDMDYASFFFSRIQEPNLFMWNTLIRGYSRQKSPESAVSIYSEMLRKGVRPDDYTFPFLLKAFTHELALYCGKELHGQVIKLGHDSNVFVQNSLIHMYNVCGSIEIAHQLFDRSSKRDVVCWNAMISGYTRSKRFEEALKLFCDMEMENVKPSSVTIVSVLSACTKLKDLEFGKRVHRHLENSEVESNLIVGNALIDMYAACGNMDVALVLFNKMKVRDIISWTAIVVGFANSGQLDLARKLFDQMPERDFISWTAMIDGYIKGNRFKEALSIFHKMQMAKIRPDEYTMVSILTSCAHLGALGVGEWIRVYIDKNNIKTDIFVANALIDMYSKCGNVDSALEIFRKMPQRDKFTWTTMIVGLAVNGHGEEALSLFSEMLRASVRPDEITYIGVLSACTHAGLVDKGRKYFSSMTNEHGIVPTLTHYGCMVDLFGRAGQLENAREFIEKMPMKPNSIVWGAFLGACRIHKRVELAEIAAQNLLDLEPENGAVYVLLCNIYAACNRWEEVHKVRQLMADRRVKKTPGCSLIEMDGIIHEFVAGDCSHPRSNEIYVKLDEMARELKYAGYVPNGSEVLIDIREEEKETLIFQHSEKLAIAFGLISSRSGVTIRIVKNLRMCVDCHNATKYVSKIYDREVIVRDRTRFHHFKNGSCSCKDYW